MDIVSHNLHVVYKYKFELSIDLLPQDLLYLKLLRNP